MPSASPGAALEAFREARHHRFGHRRGIFLAHNHLVGYAQEAALDPEIHLSGAYSCGFLRGKHDLLITKLLAQALERFSEDAPVCSLHPFDFPVLDESVIYIQ